jgi:hypothetical protein
MKHFLLYIFFGLTILLVSHQAEAKDLVDAASAAQSLMTKIGVAAIGIGITVGGILFAVGAAQIGRMVLISGLVGAICILGGPGLLSLLGRVFGVSL